MSIPPPMIIPPPNVLAQNTSIPPQVIQSTQPQAQLQHSQTDTSDAEKVINVCNHILIKIKNLNCFLGGTHYASTSIK